MDVLMTLDGILRLGNILMVSANPDRSISVTILSETKPHCGAVDSRFKDAVRDATKMMSRVFLAGMFPKIISSFPSIEEVDIIDTFLMKGGEFQILFESATGMFMFTYSFKKDYIGTKLIEPSLPRAVKEFKSSIVSQILTDFG